MIERAELLRRLWRPRALARVGAPLTLALIVTWVDAQRMDLFPHPPPQAVHVGFVLLAALLAAYAVRGFTQILGTGLGEYVGLGRARSLATFSGVVLYIIVILLAIDGAGLNLSGLLLGGALTGVIVGIAAQASLSNVMAGLVILFARPYSAGMFITARTGGFGGVEYSGQVWDISLFYTTLHSADLEVRIPNSAMIGAVVVLRPQENDVYIPVTMPLTTDLPAFLDKVRRTVESCLEIALEPQVRLESITDVGYIVSVRIFVASEPERRAVERVVARLRHDETPTATAEDSAHDTPNQDTRTDETRDSRSIAAASAGIGAPAPGAERSPSGVKPP